MEKLAESTVAQKGEQTTVVKTVEATPAATQVQQQVPVQ